jgi:hypothetical protein
MATEPDTAGHHLEHPTLSEHLNTIFRGGTSTHASHLEEHPPGPALVIGGALALCPYCSSPHRGPHRQDTPDQRQRQQILRAWKARYGNLCPGTPWCDTPDQTHPVAPGDLTIDHRTAQTTGGEPSDDPAVICHTADSRKK